MLSDFSIVSKMREKKCSEKDHPVAGDGFTKKSVYPGLLFDHSILGMRSLSPVRPLVPYVLRSLVVHLKDSRDARTQGI